MPAMTSHRKPSVAYVGIGGNLGDRRETLRSAIRCLHRPPDAIVDLGTDVASLYETSPVGGPPGQPDYLNSCVRLVTTLEPRVLLSFLRGVEDAHGRTRTDHWGPRTLDLDLLLYDQCVVQEGSLFLPHPSIPERGFVIEPLAELAGELEHPVLHQSLTALRDRWRAARGTQRVLRRQGPEWAR
jgi:2-amino-4-hydroxy-6-hydroxymethyldihydropteridine diphosphokinase